MRKLVFRGCHLHIDLHNVLLLLPELRTLDLKGTCLYELNMPTIPCPFLEEAELNWNLRMERGAYAHYPRLRHLTHLRTLALPAAFPLNQVPPCVQTFACWPTAGPIEFPPSVTNLTMEHDWMYSYSRMGTFDTSCLAPIGHNLISLTSTLTLGAGVVQMLQLCPCLTSLSLERMTDTLLDFLGPPSSEDDQPPSSHSILPELLSLSVVGTFNTVKLHRTFNLYIPRLTFLKLRSAFNYPAPIYPIPEWAFPEAPSLTHLDLAFETHNVDCLDLSHCYALQRFDFDGYISKFVLPSSLRTWRVGLMKILDPENPLVFTPLHLTDLKIDSRLFDFPALVRTFRALPPGTKRMLERADLDLDSPPSEEEWAVLGAQSINVLKLRVHCHYDFMSLIPLRGLEILEVSDHTGSDSPSSIVIDAPRLTTAGFSWKRRDGPITLTTLSPSPDARFSACNANGINSGEIAALMKKEPMRNVLVCLFHTHIPQLILRFILVRFMHLW